MKTKNICTLRYNLPQGCGPYRLFDPTISEPGKMCFSRQTLRRYLRPIFILTSVTNWQWLTNTDHVLVLIRQYGLFYRESGQSHVRSHKGTHLLATLSPAEARTAHFMPFTGSWLFLTPVFQRSSLTGCRHQLAQRTLKIKSAFPVTGEKHPLANQLLCWGVEYTQFCQLQAVEIQKQ